MELTFGVFEVTLEERGLTMTSSCSLWGSFAPLGAHLDCLGGSLGVPGSHLAVHWVHFRVLWASKTHPKLSRIVIWLHIEI